MIINNKIINNKIINNKIINFLNKITKCNNNGKLFTSNNNLSYFLKDLFFHFNFHQFYLHKAFNDDDAL